MNLITKKKSINEYCENIYGLGVMYLRKHNDSNMKVLLERFEYIQSEIEKCSDEDSFNKYKELLQEVIDKIEAIINE